MRLLAFSDLHRDVETTRTLLRAATDADAIVVAGDFATQGVGARDTLDVLAKSSVPVVVVHGNHDDPAEIVALCAQSETLHYLHGTQVVLHGKVFFGLGGEIPSRNGFPWNASETEERAAQLLDTCSKEAVVVTHTPPFGIADLQNTGEHEGSTAILDMISVKQPKLLLCGHIHHAWGMSGQSGQTWVHNLGPTENWFEV